MNKKGQSLILLVIVMPIILVLFCFMIDYSVITYNKVKLNNLTKNIITNYIDRNEKDGIIKLYNSNDFTIEDIDINSGDTLAINVTIKINSFMGKIVNKDYYLINCFLEGYQDNNKIIIKKG